MGNPKRLKKSQKMIKIINKMNEMVSSCETMENPNIQQVAFYVKLILANLETQKVDSTYFVQCATNTDLGSLKFAPFVTIKSAK